MSGLLAALPAGLRRLWPQLSSTGWWVMSMTACCAEVRACIVCAGGGGDSRERVLQHIATLLVNSVVSHIRCYRPESTQTCWHNQAAACALTWSRRVSCLPVVQPGYLQRCHASNMLLCTGGESCTWNAVVSIYLRDAVDAGVQCQGFAGTSLALLSIASVVRAGRRSRSD